MRNKLAIILVISILTQIKMVGQGYLIGVRNTNYEGFTIINTSGEELFKLDLRMDPVTSDVIIGSNSYPNTITIPLNKDKFIMRYADQFYLINTHGEIINKLHPNTEWVYKWQSEIPRVSLKNYPLKGSFGDIFIDENANQIFEGEVFDDADDFTGEFAPVKREGSKEWVLINKSGHNKIDINSMLEEDSETLYNAFHNIWSYRKKSTHEERFVTKSGVNFRTLVEAINEYHDIQISEALLQHNASELNDFLFDGTSKYIFLRSRDSEGNMIQGLYDRELNKIEITKPEEDGRYYFLRSNQDYVYGTFEYKDKSKESIVVDVNKNEIVFRTNAAIQTVIDRHILSKAESRIRLIDFDNNILLELKESNYLSASENFDRVDIPNETEILEIIDFKENSIPSNIMKQSKQVKTLILNECRQLLGEEISSQNFPKLEHLIIIRCNMLKKYNPWDKGFVNLKSYANGLRVEFGKEEKLTVSNKL